MADAQDAEAKRLAGGDHGPSPMPKSEYRQDHGDYNLLSVAALPLDLDLRVVVEGFANLDSEGRNKARASISMNELYTLIHFAKRSAVMSLSEKSPKRCEEGLVALAMIDERRIDVRDAAWVAGLLGYASTSLKQGSESLFRQVRLISTNGIAGVLRQGSTATTLSDWGYAEISDGGKFGLIGYDNFKYEPSLPLTEIAINVSNHLGDGRYITEPTIATKLPTIWFPKTTRSSAETALKVTLGTVMISGMLREGTCDAAAQQMFNLWLAETPRVAESNNLRSYIGDGVKSSGRSVVGFSVGRLFGLGVAGSWVEGISSYESLESLTAIVKTVEKQFIGIECA